MRLARAAMVVGMCVSSSLNLCAQEKPAANQVKAVRFGKLWDAKGKVWSNAIVIIAGNKILSVTSDVAAIPAGAQGIDLSKYTGLPGLIDAHTHMTMYTDETPGQPMLKQITGNPPAVEGFFGRKRGMRALEAGVSTLGEFGADQNMA